MLKLFGMLLLVKNTFLMLLKGAKWYSKYTDIASGVTVILYFWENEILLTYEEDLLFSWVIIQGDRFIVSTRTPVLWRRTPARGRRSLDIRPPPGHYERAALYNSNFQHVLTLYPNVRRDLESVSFLLIL